MDCYSVAKEVAWSDTDPNSHLRHSAYSDFATHARVSFFAAHGFSLDRLSQHQCSPILLREETVFLREVLLGEEVQIGVELKCCTENYSRYTIQHRITKKNRKEAARVVVDGAWVHRLTRTLMLPPKLLIAKVLDIVPRAPDFSFAPQDRYDFV